MSTTSSKTSSTWTAGSSPVMYTYFKAVATRSSATSKAVTVKVTCYAWLQYSTSYFNYKETGHFNITGGSASSGTIASSFSGTTKETWSKTYSFSNWTSGSKTVSYWLTGQKTLASSSSPKTISLACPSYTPATYTVSYNANGGSGAPSSQTKTCDVTLTLSSTKPTRTGYTFSKWNTNSSGTGTSYSAGGSYTANAAVTLYAVWSINSYTYTFNANGGSSNTTKTLTYNSTLSFSDVTTPTRSGYNFRGWSTDADATEPEYTSESTLTVTASSKTFYAVWEVAYQAPAFTSIKAYRCDESGEESDEGVYAKVDIAYSVDSSATLDSVKIEVTGKDGVSISGVSYEFEVDTDETSGVVLALVYANESTLYAFSTDSQYTIAVSISDDNGYTATISTYLSRAFFTMDVGSQGYSWSVGAPADTEADSTNSVAVIKMQQIYLGTEAENASSRGTDAFIKFGDDVQIIGIHPVGSVYTTSSPDVDPTNYFGGTWELFDKDLAYKTIMDTGSGGLFTASNVSSYTVLGRSAGHSLFIRFSLVTSSALSDTAVALGTINYNALGVNGSTYPGHYVTAYGDSGNDAVMINVSSAGVISAVDLVATSSMASGNSVNGEFSCLFSVGALLDDYCDKFYWKRTA